MRVVFADTSYWIAVARPGDPWKAAANAARKQVGDALSLTTDEVLAEFLTALSAGSTLRRQAATMTRAILMSANVRVPQSHESFMQALELYESREDKDYSLIDCVSMNAMRATGVTDVFTNDHHFEQEGFIALMKNRDESPRLL